MSSPIRLVIADDHPIFLHGLKTIISSDPSIKLIAEANNGLAAWELIQQHQPQVVILDIEMPKLSGFKVAEKIIQSGLPVKIIFLTMYRDEELLKKAIELGVLGYVLKENAVLDILSAIETVFAGNRFISAQLTHFLLNSKVNQSHTPKEDENVESTGVVDLLKLLSSAELRVLHLVAKHGTNKSISEDLFLSTKTVENHRSNICKKLGITGSFSLNRWVITHYDEITAYIKVS